VHPTEWFRLLLGQDKRNVVPFQLHLFTAADDTFNAGNGNQYPHKRDTNTYHIDAEENRHTIYRILLCSNHPFFCHHHAIIHLHSLKHFLHMDYFLRRNHTKRQCKCQHNLKPQYRTIEPMPCFFCQ